VVSKCGGEARFPSLDYVIAHELGHVYAARYGKEFQWFLDLVASEPQGTGHVLGISFENSVRPMGQQRPYE
jgi:hypothetical protein